MRNGGRGCSLAREKPLDLLERQIIHNAVFRVDGSDIAAGSVVGRGDFPQGTLDAGVRDFGVDNMLLDFGVSVGDKLQQSEYLPPELIVAWGRFRMGVIFSAIQLPRG